MAFAVTDIIMTALLEICFTRINKKRAYLNKDKVKAMYTEEIAAFGDPSALYRYTV